MQQHNNIIQPQQPLNHLPDRNRPVVQYVNDRQRPIHCHLGVKNIDPVNFRAVNYVFGPEARRDFIRNHPHLKYYEKPKEGQFSQIAFNDRENHGHPLGGDTRSFCDLAKKRGPGRGCRILDVGGSLWRNITSGDVDHFGNFINRRLCERVFTMWPIVDARDQERLAKLEWNMERDPDVDELKALRAAYSCHHLGEGRDLPTRNCPCENGEYDLVNMTDSHYYQGALAQTFKIMIKNRTRRCKALVSGFDYHAAWMNNKREGACADGESRFEFCPEGIMHDVKANLAPYKHAILRTDGKECFEIEWKGHHFNFMSMSRHKNGDLEYVTWEVTLTPTRIDNIHVVKAPYLFSPHLESSNDTRLSLTSKCVAEIKDYAYYVREAGKKRVRQMNKRVAKSIQDVQECFNHLSHNKRENIKYLDATDQYKMTICDSFFGIPYNVKTYIVDAEPVESLFSSFLYRRQLGEMVRITRAAFATLTAPVPEGMEPGPQGWGLSILEATNIQKVTTILAQRVATDLLDTVMTSQTKKKLDFIMTNPFAYKEAPSFFIFLSSSLLLMALFWGISFISRRITSAITVNAQFTHASQQTPDEWVPMVLVALLVGWIHTYVLRPRKARHAVRNDHRAWYESDCEHQDANCDLSRRARFDPKFKVRGEVLKQFPNKWVCDTKMKVGPVVVGPRYMGMETEFVATQNHPCSRSIASSIWRMIQLECKEDDAIWEEFETYVMEEEFPKFLDAMKTEGFKIVMEDWKKRYPVLYREELQRLEEDPDYFMPTAGSNKMFCKTDELNVPTFNHCDRFTKLNKIKKRAICDPNHQDKARVNAFCYFLSKLSQLANPRYNVGRNYMETAKFIDEFERFSNLIYFAADGSSFDATQRAKMNRLFYKLIELILKHPNFETDQDISPMLILDTFMKQLTLNVKAFNGDIKFKAEGRGSGHGWTTVINTNLNIWYYSFLMKRAGVLNDEWDGAFQGDDNICGVGAHHIGSIEAERKKLFLDKDAPVAHGLGQICKKIAWGDITDLDFISCHFYRLHTGDLRMVRILGRVFPTIGLSTTAPKPPGSSNMTDEEIDAFYANPHIRLKCDKAGSEKAVNGLDWAGGTFMEVVYQKMWELCGGHVIDYDNMTTYEREKRNYTYAMAVWKQNEPDFGAYRAFVRSRYDVTDCMIDDFLEAVISLNSPQDILCHPFVDAVIRKDCC